MHEVHDWSSYAEVDIRSDHNKPNSSNSLSLSSFPAQQRWSVGSRRRKQVSSTHEPVELRSMSVGRWWAMLYGFLWAIFCVFGLDRFITPHLTGLGRIEVVLEDKQSIRITDGFVFGSWNFLHHAVWLLSKRLLHISFEQFHCRRMDTHTFDRFQVVQELYE